MCPCVSRSAAGWQDELPGGHEAYRTDVDPIQARGTTFSAEELKKVEEAAGEVLWGRRGKEELGELLASVVSTEFEAEGVEAILGSDETSIEDWRAGEAVAQAHLAENADCLFPWGPRRDLKNPLASPAGAELVGFDRAQNPTRLALGEVKTSGQEQAPPTVVHGTDGLNAQLVAIRDEKAICQNVVAGNTNLNVDTVIRPTFNGLLAFQSIRNASAPETYSWEVKLPEGEKLKLIDSKDAEIDFANGTEAMLITTEFAHDALGKEVPTSLSVSQGNILTLTVSHRGATYTYPVVAGLGWEGGFETEIVPRPLDEQEIREERERIEREEREAFEHKVQEEMEGGGDESPGDGVEVWNTSTYRPKPGSVYTGAPELVDSIHRTRRSKAQASYCATISCSIWHTWEVGTWFWNGTQHQVGGAAWRGDTAHKCFTDAHPLVTNDILKLGWSGPNPAPYGHGEHLNLWCNFHVVWFNINDVEDDHYTEEDHLYGDGYQKQHIRQYYVGPVE